MFYKMYTCMLIKIFILIIIACFLLMFLLKIKVRYIHPKHFSYYQLSQISTEAFQGMNSYSTSLLHVDLYQFTAHWYRETVSRDIKMPCLGAYISLCRFELLITLELIIN